MCVEEGNGRGNLCPRRGILSPSCYTLHPVLHLQMKLVSEHYPETCLSGRLLCHAEMCKLPAATEATSPVSLSGVPQYLHTTNESITTREETPPCRQCRKKREGHSKKLCTYKCLLLEILQVLVSQLCNGTVLSHSKRWSGNARLM